MQGLQRLNRRILVLQIVFFNFRLLPQGLAGIRRMAVSAALDDMLKLNDGLVSAAWAVSPLPAARAACASA